MLYRISALVIAAIFLLPAALFNAVAWGGQWRCSYMGWQAIIGDIIGAFGIALAIRMWPFSIEVASKRKLLTKVILVILIGCVTYILFLSPECPYAAR